MLAVPQCGQGPYAQLYLNEVWGVEHQADLASLRVFMGTLRKKIESDPAHPRYIQTHVGVGYRMIRATAAKD